MEIEGKEDCFSIFHVKGSPSFSKLNEEKLKWNSEKTVTLILFQEMSLALMFVFFIKSVGIISKQNGLALLFGRGNHLVGVAPVGRSGNYALIYQALQYRAGLGKAQREITLKQGNRNAIEG